MDYFDAFWDSLETKISAAWSDATVKYRATQSRRINWRELIKQEDLATPFVVAAVGRAEPSEEGAVNCRSHDVPVALYYVRRSVLTAAEVAAGSRIVERFLEAKGKTMVDALLDSTDATYQVFQEPTVDAGDTNPANALLIEDGSDLIAVEVSFVAHIGEV